MKELRDLLLHKGAEKVQIFAQQRTCEQISFKNNTINQLVTKQLTGMRIEIVKDGKVTSLATSDLSQPERLADQLMEMVQYGDAVKYDYVAPGAEYPVVNLVQPKIYEPTIEDLIAAGEKVIQTVQDYDSAIEVAVEIERSRETKRLINSYGLNLTSVKDIYYAVNYGVLVEGDNFSTVYSVDQAKYGVVDYKKIAREVVEQMKLARNPVAMESGRYPVIFTPKAVGQICLAFEGLFGEYVAKGLSPLKNKIDTQILHESITLIDNGTLNNGPYTDQFDDEGTPTQRTLLVENGVLKQFLHNLESAEELNATPTGNAFKGRGEYKRQPYLNFTNLLFTPGDTSYEEMISGIELGIVIDDIMGLMMGNLTQGMINSDIDMAYKVVNGKIVGRVKNGAIGTNVYKLFKDHLVALEDQVTPIAVDGFTSFAPHVLCKDVNITIG